MPEQFLHGVQVVEASDGARPIRSVRSSVIGIVGSGDSDGVDAFAEIGANNAKLLFTAKDEGLVGNAITVRAVNPGTNNATLSVSVTAKAITINLATDGTATATSTANQVLNAVNASSPASALVTASLGTGSTGASAYAVHTAVQLSGGVEPSFPLNTPVLLTNAAGVTAKVGASSFLGKALEAIYKQAGAIVIVVRADTSAGSATDFTGVYALKRSQQVLGQTPRILVAENAGSDDGVLDDVKSVASSLRAIAVVGLTDSAASTDATAWVTGSGNERIFALWPTVNGGQDPSPFVAGAIAKSDNDRGFWWSPSNFEVLGIETLDMPVDFQFGDSTSLANVLNEGNVTTFIKRGGWRIWGNRTGSVDPKWAFLCIRRTADIINDSVLDAHFWAVDRGITPTYLDDVTEGVNAYLRGLKNIGAILGGKCWPTPNLNTPANITQGKVYFSFDFSGVYPAENITFSSMLVNDYIEEVFPSA